MVELKIPRNVLKSQRVTKCTTNTLIQNNKSFDSVDKSDDQVLYITEDTTPRVSEHMKNIKIKQSSKGRCNNLNINEGETSSKSKESFIN